MTSEMVSVRLELGIQPEKFIQMVQVRNHELEKRIEAGINKAVEELSQDDAIETLVCNAVKDGINNHVKSFMWKWKFEQQVETEIIKLVTKKSTEYAEKVTDALMKSLTKLSDEEK